MIRRRLLLPLLGFALMLPLAGLAAPRVRQEATPAAATPRPDAYAQITTRIFADNSPAPVVNGQLALALVTVPAGATIGAHFHPGSQFAAIAEGELTYTVETGKVFLLRAGGDPAGAWDEITPGETVVLTAGDSIRAQPGDVHRAENAGDVPVLIWIASLFPDDSPRALPAPEPTP
ncbi:MAG: cupin domain-containing protein [Chloroflexota bacterium]